MNHAKTIYLGPYLECETTLSDGSPVSVNACSHDGCVMKGAAVVRGFCGACGRETGPTELPGPRLVLPNVYAAELVVGVRLSLYRKATIDHHDVLLSNRPECDPHRKYHLEQDRHLIGCDPRMQQDENERFAAFFADDIIQLRALYGKDKVRVKWGLFIHTAGG